MSEYNFDLTRKEAGVQGNTKTGRNYGYISFRAFLGSLRELSQRDPSPALRERLAIYLPTPEEVRIHPGVCRLASESPNLAETNLYCGDADGCRAHGSIDGSSLAARTTTCESSLKRQDY